MDQCPLDKTSDQPLYRQLADWVGQLIFEGTFEAGRRLPSIRQLSEQLSVSKTTVIDAFRLLEDWGFVEARPRSGYFVQPPERRQPLAGAAARPRWRTTPRLLEAASESQDPTVRMMVAGARNDVLQLGMALPHPHYFPTERLSKLLSRVVRQRPEDAAGHCPSPGFEQLRVQIARRAVAAGVSISPEEIIITNGASEALMLSLRAVAAPGMHVAVASPTYNGFLELLKMCGGRAVEIETDPGDGMNIDALREAADRVGIDAIFAVPNVCNPTGVVVSDAKKQAIAEFASQRGIPIIEDDVNAELVYAADRPSSIRAHASGADVLWCGSFSKTLAPGFRVGWVAPAAYAQTVAKIKATTSLTTPTPQQMALAELLEAGGYDHHLKQLRESYRGAVETMRHLVKEYFPDGTVAHEPQGGHLLWVRLPEGVDSIQLAQRALAEKISIGPGPMFSAERGFRNYIRLNCAVEWTPSARQSVRRLGELVGEQLSSPVTRRSANEM